MKATSQYFFWDLIAEEAYLPKNSILKDGTIERFKKREKEKKVYIFAANEACRVFIQNYKDELNIVGVLDNAKVKWNSEWEGMPVLSPEEIVPTLSEEESVIIIAMRLNSDKVANQLQELGFYNLYSLGVILSGLEPYKSFVKEITILKEKTHLEDIVLMESTNDFDGNSGALYEYLRKQGSKHRFIWIVKSKNNFNKLLSCDDKVLCPHESIEDLKEYALVCAKAKWEIWDNFPIRKVRSDQINIFLQHYGMGYKQVSHLYSAPDYVDYVLTTNQFVHEMEKESITYAPSTEFIYGELPRNDVLFSNEWNELEKITHKQYKKVVMWAPTLRESGMHNRTDSDIKYPYGISVIYDEDAMEMLNQFLKERNMLLIIKIHPRQKINYVDNEYSNIIYLNGENVKKIHPYKLLTQVDAMITDYSSIVFDYMLLDRPIAWALEDRDHYQIEYLMDNPMEYMPGEKIYSLQDIFSFLENVKNNIDLYKEQRGIISARCNAPAKGMGCKALVEKLKL